jgi:predicted RNA-binding Zn ribbon-like protein
VRTGRDDQAGLSAEPLIWNEFPCLDLIDSEFRDHTGTGRVFDRLPLPRWQQLFLDRWVLEAPVPATPETVERLRALRRQVRRLLESISQGKGPARKDAADLNHMLESQPFMYQVDRRFSLQTVPLKPGWDAVIVAVVKSAIELCAPEHAERVKRCANPDCSWMFYDLTNNVSRRWCQANYCGNLTAVRAFRSRSTARSRKKHSPNWAKPGGVI